MSVGGLFAQDITVEGARTIARSFMLKTITNGARRISGNVSLNLVYEARTSEESAPCFYVFNKGTNSGFIIVSGDDRAYDILGYSDEGRFDYSHLSPEAKNWIEEYKNEIAFLRAHGQKVLNVREAPGLTHTVSPLLGDIAWNQDSPYNDQCPRYDYTTLCATGCVATAMAQIMYYHKWPDTGTGSHTYFPSILNGKSLTADFGATHYNWSEMLPAYDENSSTESRSEVARLMLHCGVSVNMEYSTSSGAMCIDVPYALVHYFNYDKGIAYRQRKNYSGNEWNHAIIKELDEGRPVFVTGYTAASGGHAFVFDGYDINGLIHINWGWGKMSNGYFRTTALTPASQGIGGSNSGFNYKQAIVTGIRKPVDGSEEDIELVSTEGLASRFSYIANGGNATITLNGKIYNADWKDDDFDYGLLLMDEKKDTVCVIPGDAGNKLAEGKDTLGTKFTDISFGILKEGSYRLYPVCRVSGGKKQWIRIHDDYVGYPNYLTLNVSGDRVHFITPNYFNLEVRKTEIPSKIYSRVPPMIKASIVNNGDVEYYGEIKVSFMDKATHKVLAQSAGYIVDLNPGDSTQLEFTDSYNLAAGSYYLNFTDENLSRIDADHDISVYDAPAETAEIVPAEQLAFPDNNNVDRENMEISAKIACTRGVFGGQIYLYIYSENGVTQKGCLNPEYLYEEKGDTVTLTFRGPFENGVPGETYKACLAKYDGEYSTYLTPRDEASCLFRLASPTGIDNYHRENDEKGAVYDLNGRIVKYRDMNDLPHGIYIIRRGSKAIKIVK